MKRLLTNYAPNKEFLEDNGIVTIYYENDGRWVAELDGAGYITEDDEMFNNGENEELLKDIQNRVTSDRGEEMDDEEVDELKSNLDFEF